MDMSEYQRVMRKGDAIFLAGGLLFLANLLAVLADPRFMVALPVGIVVMGYGSHIQYAANEGLKQEILLAISASRVPDGNEVAAIMGTHIPAEQCPQCGFKGSK